MSTYWISSFSGTDTNDGSTFALAKKTLAAGLALALTGDTINLVNDGTHLMLDFSETNAGGLIDGNVRCRGTDWVTDPGLTVQGVDSSGAPAIATIAATRVDTRRYGLMKMTNRPAYVQVKGVVWDWTAYLTNTGFMECIPLANKGGMPVRVSDFQIIGSTYGGTAPSGNRSLFGFGGGSPTDVTTVTDGWEISYGVLMNTPNVIDEYSNDTQPWNVHHVVLVWSTDDTVDVASPLKVSARTVVGDYATWSYTHNTLVYIDLYTGGTINPAVVTSVTNATDLTLHSNLLFLQPSAGAGITPITGDFFQSANTGSSGTRGTHGNNVWALSSNVTDVADWVGSGFYDRLHNPGFPTTDSDTAVYVSDLVTANVTLTDVFNEVSTSWTWSNAKGDGYSHVLPFDMRPIIGQTTGSGSSVAGAVEEAIIVDVPSTGTDTNVSDVFIDSLPFFRPILRADSMAAIKVRRNDNVNHIDLRHHLSGHIHNESTHRIVSLEATELITLSFAGVASSQSVLIQTDTEVKITLSTSGGGTLVLTMDEVAAFDNVALTSLLVSNTSAVTATVEVAVFD